MTLTAILAILLPLTACAKEPDEPSGIITMTTQASKVNIAIKLAKGADNLTIDWGDGKKSNVSDASRNESTGQFTFSRDYSGTSARNIVITGNVTDLSCYSSRLTALDVSRCTTLEWLSCGGNQLTALDVSRNTALTFLNCSRNQLTTLDVSRNAALTNLNCSSNQLTTLDVSKNTALNGLACNFNQIERLDVSKNTALKGLSIVGNLFTTSALNELFRMLPNYSKTQEGQISIIGRNPSSANPGDDDCDRSIAKEKGWYFTTLR